MSIEKEIDKVLERVKILLLERGQMYDGADRFSTFQLGHIQSLILLYTKFKRLENLLLILRKRDSWQLTEHEQEVLEDTLADVMGYSVISLILLEKK